MYLRLDQKCLLRLAEYDDVIREALFLVLPRDPHPKPTTGYMMPHTILFRSIVLHNEANSFCYVWLRVTHVRISVILMADIPPK